MSRIRQLQISVTNNFLIFHITGQFWDCWKVSVSFFFFWIFLFFFIYLFLFVFFSFFCGERERERLALSARQSLHVTREKDFRSNLLLVQSRNSRAWINALCVLWYWSACTKWCSFILQQFLIRWMNKLCARPSGMINCRRGKNDTLLRDFVCHWIRGVVPGIARINSWNI